MNGKPRALKLPPLNKNRSTIRIPIAEKHAKLGRTIQFIHAVSPPVPYRQIQFSIPIKVPGNNTRPPSSPVSESPFGGLILEHPLVVSKYSDCSPFQCQCEVGPTIPVQVGEGRAIHETDGAEQLTHFARKMQLVSIVQPYRRAYRLRVLPWLDASANEQVQIAIPVDIGQGHRSNGRFANLKLFRTRYVCH